LSKVLKSLTPTFWRGRRVLLTGATGFKGAWLALWLERLGADVTGLSLAPASSPHLFGMLGGFPAQRHVMLDIRDRTALLAAVRAAQPEVIIHMAAQALVRASYRDPAATYATNVMGTAHVMEAVRDTPSVRAAVIVTTDKVYENHGEGRPFREADRLGGHDPYSNSKACAELVVQAFRDSYLQDKAAVRVATARAGNVIGGGDWSEDRLVPDFVRAITAGSQVELRYPTAIRPWQHVLEPLMGYLMLAERLAGSDKVPEALNFGPDAEGFVTVAEIVGHLSAALGRSPSEGPGWRPQPGAHPPEAPVLTLATYLAKESLGWRPRLPVKDTLDWTASWYKAWLDGADMRSVTLAQIARYEELSA
jgi:CDP-glucose 4,6-dehydratase